MALTAYLTATKRLLQLPAAPTSLYSDSDLTSYINTARGQLSAEAECIRFMGSLTLIGAQQVYAFSAINLTGSTGVQSVMNVRTVWIALGNGQVWLRPRPFSWFSLYELNNVLPSQGLPQVWSQYGQGVNGTVYFSDIPDTSYTASVDSVCLPVDLVTDSTAEAIPRLWTDAVPYYAAYMALLSAQTSARQADAQRYFSIYQEFVQRARSGATPAILPGQYEQQPDPTKQNKLGLKPMRQAGM